MHTPRKHCKPMGFFFFRWSIYRHHQKNSSSSAVLDIITCWCYRGSCKRKLQIPEPTLTQHTVSDVTRLHPLLNFWRRKKSEHFFRPNLKMLMGWVKWLIWYNWSRDISGHTHAMAIKSIHSVIQRCVLSEKPYFLVCGINSEWHTSNATMDFCCCCVCIFFFRCVCSSIVISSNWGGF